MGGAPQALEVSAWPRSIGLIGAGAMGRAMLAGLLASRPDLAASSVVSDAVDAASVAGAAETGARTGTVEQAAGCDLVLIAVKPKDMAGALGALVGSLGDDSVVLSVAAGWPIERLRTLVPGAPLVRTMPNLAVRYGCGVMGVAQEGLDAAREASTLGLLSGLGAAVSVPEASFPVITALAGSGPGFVALVAEAMEEGAVGMGLDRAGARRLTQAVIAGTAALLADGGDPAALRHRVSSPGGTTMAGLAVLERGAVRAHIADAVRAAGERAAAL